LKSLSSGNFHDGSFDVTSGSIRRLAVLVPAALVLLGTGCATRSSLNRLRAELTATRTEVTDLRQAQDASKRDVSRVASESRALQARMGNVAAALTESRAEVARLSTRLDAAEAEARAAKAAPAPAPPASPPVVAPPARPTAPATPPARFAAPAPARQPTRPAERPRELAAKTETPEQAYNAALTTFRAREHGQAVLDFLDFIAKYPRHPLVANAQYWIGEAYYVQRDYRQAEAEFQKVPKIAPGSAKAADALLKIGLCQRNLRDEAHARQTWQRVVRDFPQSEAAVKARAFLRPEAGAARH
jgi:tol-pal system protein YbgF